MGRIGEHPAIIGVILILVVGAAVVYAVENDLLTINHDKAEPESENNVVAEYVEKHNYDLPPDVIEILEPLGENQLNGLEIDTIIELDKLGEYVNTPLVKFVISSLVEDGNISISEFNLVLDIDNDYVSNDLELRIYETNPAKLDTDDGGVDDFNEIFTYEMNATNPEDDADFMERIPNVEAKHWGIWDGGGADTSDDRVITISMRDPLIQYLAERAEIIWQIDHYGQKIGTFIVDGEEIWNGTEPNERTSDPPSYYFTHGRKSACAVSSMVNLVILRSMGYSAVMVGGEFSGTGHGWSEAFIDGEICVVDFNYVTSREYAYERKYNITQHDYNPDWYKE